MKTLYEQLEADNHSAFLALAILVYRSATPHGENPPTKAWLTRMMKDYDPVLLYVYAHEVERKRDRAAEAINAAKDKNHEFKKALSLWHNMTAQYADNVTYQAQLKAFRDAGVQRVKWVATEDERTCRECMELDGKVYQIDNIPPKPHPNCRCWLIPAD